MPNPPLLQLILSMPPETLKKLKHDYIYLIEMGRGMMMGELVRRWRDMKAGACATVRWTNPQSRTLRLYMSTPSPTFGHKRLVSFIIYVYLPALLNHVMLMEKHCLLEEKEVLRPIIQYNAYMAHPECLLQSLVGSEDQEERRKGVQDILRIMDKEAQDTQDEGEENDQKVQGRM